MPNFIEKESDIDFEEIIESRIQESFSTIYFIISSFEFLRKDNKKSPRLKYISSGNKYVLLLATMIRKVNFQIFLKKPRK